MMRRWYEALRERLRALISRHSFEADLDEELQFHLDEATRRHRAQGLSPDEARQAARRQLGSVTATRDAVLAETGVQPFHDVSRDLVHAVRLFTRRPGLSAAVVATIAIGVAANAAVFTVVNGVLLAPLPFHDADRIVRLFNVYPGADIPRTSTSLPEYLDRRAQARTLTNIAVYREESNTIDSTAGGRHTFALRVSDSFFPLLGVRAAHGRVITAADQQPGAPPVVVITDALWRSLGGRNDLVGSPLRLDGTDFTIVGVLPKTFSFPTWAAQVLTPITLRPEDGSIRARHTDAYQMIARLSDGTSLDEARAEITRLNQATVADYPADLHRRISEAGYATHMEPYLDDLTRDVRMPLLVLWAAGLVVLAIAVTNVTTLLLLRTQDRRQELAVLAALGAPQFRIQRQLIIEVAVLVATGGAVGYLGAQAGLRLLSVFEVYEIPRVDGLAAAGVAHGWALATILVALLSTGLATVLASRRLSTSLVGRSRVTHAARWPQHLLVTGQMAFAVTLVMTAGVLVASLHNLRAVDPGFDADGVSVAALIIPGARYPTPQARADVIDRIIEAINAAPGVARAAAASQLPFSGGTTRMPFSPDAPGIDQEQLVAPYGTTVTDGYFEALGITTVAGRVLQPSDRLGSERVAVIDEALARRYWPDGAVGRRFWAAAQPSSQLNATTIVGVVRTVNQQSLRDRDQPGAVYSPMAQFPSGFFRLAVKFDGTRDWPAVVRQIATVDKALVPFWTDTLTNSVDESLLFQRGPMQLVSVFAVVGLVLGAIGVYGVLAHEFSARQREIAIRLAIGGSRHHVVSLLSRRWLVLVAGGAAIGMVASVGSSRIVESLLFDVTVADVRVMIAVTAVLAAVGACAAVGPLRRALSVDPASALRQDG